MKKLLIFLIALLLPLSAFADNVWKEGDDSSVIAGGDSPSDIDTLLSAASIEPLERLLKNFREGAEIEYDTASQVTVAAGEVAVQNSAGTVVAFLSNSSSTDVTFSDLDTGSEAASTTYYIYAYCSDSTNDLDFDIAISTNSSTPTGISYYRRLGSFYNDSDSDIVATSINNDDDIEFDDALDNFTYDSGWFAVAQATEYSKTHDLGTTNVMITILVSDSSDGSGVVTTSAGTSFRDHNPQVNVGLITSDLTTSVIEVQSGKYIDIPTASAGLDNSQALTSGYARVLMLALD